MFLGMCLATDSREWYKSSLQEKRGKMWKAMGSSNRSGDKWNATWIQLLLQVNKCLALCEVSVCLSVCCDCESMEVGFPPTFYRGVPWKELRAGEQIQPWSSDGILCCKKFSFFFCFLSAKWMIVFLWFFFFPCLVVLYFHTCRSSVCLNM